MGVPRGGAPTAVHPGSLPSAGPQQPSPRPSHPIKSQMYLEDLVSDNDDARCHAAPWGRLGGPRCHASVLSASAPGPPVGTQTPGQGPKAVEACQLYRALGAIAREPAPGSREPGGARKDKAGAQARTVFPQSPPTKPLTSDSPTPQPMLY